MIFQSGTQILYAVCVIIWPLVPTDPIHGSVTNRVSGPTRMKELSIWRQMEGKIRCISLGQNAGDGIGLAAGSHEEMRTTVIRSMSFIIITGLGVTGFTLSTSHSLMASPFPGISGLRSWISTVNSSQSVKLPTEFRKGQQILPT